jgi:SulP family sulfate permease
MPEAVGFSAIAACMIDRFALHDKDERAAASASLH